MTAAEPRVGPRRPGETRDGYIKRLVQDAPRPTQEGYARLAALLRVAGDQDDLYRASPVKP